jgi:cytochrome c-type biogenesis protein CcmH/NrfG
MSISTESINSVIEELQTIKWLLVMLVAISTYFTFLFFGVLKKLGEPTSLVGRQLYTKKRQAELEDLLAKGDAVAVKFSALEWIANQPGEPYAHWFLAKAYYQLGAMLEAKKSFTHLLAMSPDWETTITPWLERIDSEISPKVVK